MSRHRSTHGRAGPRRGPDAASTRWAAALALVVAVSVPVTLAVSPEQLERNQTAWDGMSGQERDELRLIWKRFISLPETESRALVRRQATRDRLNRGMEKRLGRSVTRDDVRDALLRLPDRLPERLANQGIRLDPERSLAGQVREHTEARIEAFLDSLDAAGSLDAGERPEADSLPWDEYVRLALELRKREELLLERSEGTLERDERSHAALELAAPLPFLQALDPLDLDERLLERRRRQGLLGQGAGAIHLSEDDLQQLADIPGEQFARRAPGIIRPHVRTLLEDMGVQPAEIERVLKLPYRQLERDLHNRLKGS